MATQPAYQGAPLVGLQNIATANTARDGTGTIATLCVGRVPGTRIERIKVKATVTTTLGMVRIFKRDSGLTLAADGSIASFSAPTWRLIEELPIAALTVSASVEGAESEVTFADGLTLAPFESLGAATHNAENMNVAAFGGHL